MICLLLGWPCWILTNYKSSPKCPAGQLSQISSVISWEPKTIKKPCTFHDFRVHYIWVLGGNWTIWVSYRKRCMCQFVVSYNNSFRILRSLPMRCSASAMFASSNVDSVRQESDDLYIVCVVDLMSPLI